MRAIVYSGNADDSSCNEHTKIESKGLERKTQKRKKEMKEYGINVGKANAVFEQIESDKYSEDEKLRSILVVLDMPTHNGIKKDTILKALRWLFEYAIEVDDK